MTKPSMMGVREVYSSVASSALSPWASSTGVVWVWKPVMVLGLPAWRILTCQHWQHNNHHQTRLETLTAPTTSTAWPTRTLTGSGLSSSSKVTSILGCMAVASPYSR